MKKPSLKEAKAALVGKVLSVMGNGIMSECKITNVRKSNSKLYSFLLDLADTRNNDFSMEAAAGFIRQLINRGATLDVVSVNYYLEEPEESGV